MSKYVQSQTVPPLKCRQSIPTSPSLCQQTLTAMYSTDWQYDPHTAPSCLHPKKISLLNHPLQKSSPMLSGLQFTFPVSFSSSYSFSDHAPGLNCACHLWHSVTAAHPADQEQAGTPQDCSDNTHTCSTGNTHRAAPQNLSRKKPRRM